MSITIPTALSGLYHLFPSFQNAANVPRPTRIAVAATTRKIARRVSISVNAPLKRQVSGFTNGKLRLSEQNLRQKLLPVSVYFSSS